MSRILEKPSWLKEDMMAVHTIDVEISRPETEDEVHTCAELMAH
jgi:hypothetical protein